MEAIGVTLAIASIMVLGYYIVYAVSDIYD